MGNGRRDNDHGNGHHEHGRHDNGYDPERSDSDWEDQERLEEEIDEGELTSRRPSTSSRPPPPPDVIRAKLQKTLDDKAEFFRVAKDAFYQFDRDNDDYLDFEETQRLVKRLCDNLSVPEVDQDTLTRVFNKYDEDKLGGLTMDQFAQFYWRLLWNVRDKYYSDRQVQIRRENYIGHFVNMRKDFNIYERYEFRRKIGEGGFGVVHLVYDRILNLICVCKTIDKSILGEGSTEIESEIQSLKSLDHPNIIKVYDVYDTEDYVYILMEYCNGGELTKLINDSMARGKLLNELFVCHIIYQLINSINYIHQHGIVHKDIKPDNIMFATHSIGFKNSDKNNSSGGNHHHSTSSGNHSSSSGGNHSDDNHDGDDNIIMSVGFIRSLSIKVIDFGLSEFFNHEKYIMTAGGTVLYMAPEVFKFRMNSKCDIWSIGCLLYVLLSGHLPFNGSDFRIIKHKILSEEPNYKAHCGHVSLRALDMIKQCLQKDHHKRPSAKLLLKHKWFRLLNSSTAQLMDDDPRHHPRHHQPLPIINREIKLNFRKFTKQADIKLALINMMAHHLDWRDTRVQQISRLFNDLDRDHNGVLSADELRRALTLEPCPLEPWDINMVLQALDVNNDGTISYTEFLAAAYTWKLSEINLVYSAFNKLDTDQDGKIQTEDLALLLLGYDPGLQGPDKPTDHDLTKAQLTTKKKLKKSINDIDTNHDGIIDWDEFATYITK
ncbi:protein kinase domain protein [Gregarina niphandrodes]|uniref:non-specific serine/threonine protein kinase n=1 Tax=Gregarina niphandrodes TaxID=110365 RepID=A0A023AY99_GRENI|nr:protein kinase domain protein [Gregarina niphandrodes]EZG43634.1 protein kinase domain protein [Gregarina niphandrodes]|eukprot:XP_011133137.1 protein kinase domain protein [Gregarina niphandrodes]